MVGRGGEAHSVLHEGAVQNSCPRLTAAEEEQGNPKTRSSRTGSLLGAHDDVSVRQLLWKWRMTFGARDRTMLLNVVSLCDTVHISDL